MIVKEKFELIYGKSGKIYNILPVNKYTIDAFSVSNEDLSHLSILINSYARSRPSELSLITKYINNVSVVRLDDYPLPGFVTKDGIPCVNLSVLPSAFISDYASSDIFSMYLYAIALRTLVVKKPFEDSIEEHISNFFMLIFMNLFAKKHGLTGSYKDKIPILKALISLYVHTSMMGNKLTESVINKISNKHFIDVNEIDLKYDITTTTGFLRSIKQNNIITLSENLFSTTIINRTGISGLCFFEDISRMFATILASSISGNSIFSNYFKKVQTKTFDKLVYIGYTNMKRSL